MMTNLMGEVAAARVNELHAEADRQRTVLLARSQSRDRRRARRAARAEPSRVGRHDRLRRFSVLR